MKSSTKHAVELSKSNRLEALDQITALSYV